MYYQVFWRESKVDFKIVNIEKNQITISNIQNAKIFIRIIIIGTMLEKEYKFYKDNSLRIQSEYKDKFIIIIGEEIIGAFNTKKAALAKTLKSHKLGTFLMQYVSDDSAISTHRFYSRVYV